MFRTDVRTYRQNQRLAGFLALIAGNVNSAGFLLIGSFTSHVTGNIGRFADDVALHQSAAPFALLMVVAFFAGAFTSSMMLESNAIGSRARAYGVLLLGEGGLLASFALLSYVIDTRNPRFHDVQAVVLCFAMGMQNSFVTRLSSAVVRTTHLTGVVTDLAIEGARWFRLWRARLGKRTQLRLVLGDAPAELPQVQRTMILVTIVVAFFVGSMLGAVMAVYVGGQLSLLLPTVALFASGTWVLRDGREWRLRRDVA